jgi:hypothetical protein
MPTSSIVANRLYVAYDRVGIAVHIATSSDQIGYARGWPIVSGGVDFDINLSVLRKARLQILRESCNRV